MTKPKLILKQTPQKKKTAKWPPKELEPFRVSSITVLTGPRFKKMVTYKDVAVKLGQMGGMTIIMLKDKIVEVASMRIYEMVCNSDTLIYQITYKEMLEDWAIYAKQKQAIEAKMKEEEKPQPNYG